jgi:hypothetical protein
MDAGLQKDDARAAAPGVCLRGMRLPGALDGAGRAGILGAMTERTPPPRPARTPETEAEHAARRARAAAALRENLRKRKQQARSRAAAAAARTGG